MAGWWLSPGTPVSSTNNTDRHNITEILSKVSLNTINQTKPMGTMDNTSHENSMKRFTSMGGSQFCHYMGILLLV